VVVRADNDVPSEYLQYEQVEEKLSSLFCSLRVRGTFEVRGATALVTHLNSPSVRTPQVVGLPCHPPRLRCYQLTFGALALTKLRFFLRRSRRRPPWPSRSFRASVSPGQASLPTLLGFARRAISGASPSAPPSTYRQESAPTAAFRPLLRHFGCHPKRSFRPRGFAPPRRLPPTRRARACCIPIPILGFLAFLAIRPSPRRGFVPPEGSSSFGAVSRHRDPFPLAVSTTSRLCSPSESVDSTRCCQHTETRSSLGFVPLQGLSRPSHFPWRKTPCCPLRRSGA